MCKFIIKVQRLKAKRSKPFTISKEECIPCQAVTDMKVTGTSEDVDE